VTEICESRPSDRPLWPEHREEQALPQAGQHWPGCLLALSSALSRHLRAGLWVKADVGVKGEQPLLTRLADLEQRANWE